MEKMIGELFSKLLAERGMNAHSFALYTGMSPSTIADIAAGKSIPRADTLLKIADGLGVDVRELYGLSGDVSIRNNRFLCEVYYKSIGYDEISLGKVLGYMDRVTEERESNKKEDWKPG